MSNATATCVDNSRAVCEPFALDSGRSQGNVAELFRRIYMDNRTASPSIRLEIEMIRRILEQLGRAISFDWLMSSQFFVVQKTESGSDALAIQQVKNRAAIQLLEEWMADESGYDEETWPIVKEAIEEDRLSYRRRLND